MDVVGKLLENEEVSTQTNEEVRDNYGTAISTKEDATADEDYSLDEFCLVEEWHASEPENEQVAAGDGSHEESGQHNCQRTRTEGDQQSVGSTGIIRLHSNVMPTDEAEALARRAQRFGVETSKLAEEPDEDDSWDDEPPPKEPCIRRFDFGFEAYEPLPREPLVHGTPALRFGFASQSYEPVYSDLDPHNTHTSRLMHAGIGKVDKDPAKLDERAKRFGNIESPREPPIDASKLEARAKRFGTVAPCLANDAQRQARAQRFDPVQNKKC